MRLEQFFYVSRARDSLGERDIDDILVTSRERNARCEITGHLLYTGEHFGQVLEGPCEALDAVIASIARDARHSRMRTLMRRPLETRAFPQWTMGYVRRLGAADLLEQLMSAPAVSSERAGRIVEGLFLQPD